VDKIVLKIYNFACGIAASAENPASNPDLDLTIDGTGFFLDSRTVVTANHVIKESNDFILQGLPGHAFQWIKIDKSSIERFDDIDICLFKLQQPADNVVPINIDSTELNMLDDVFTFGYPFAVEKPEKREIRTRSFKGHITSTYSIGVKKIYELSFHCPRMLSGGPLVVTDLNGITRLKGVVLGNEISDITVEKTKEIEKEAGKEYTYERVESFHRGIALQAASLAERFSKTLNCRIGDFVPG
jgi:hypothetical protein